MINPSINTITKNSKQITGYVICATIPSVQLYLFMQNLSAIALAKEDKAKQTQLFSTQAGLGGMKFDPRKYVYTVVTKNMKNEPNS